MTLLVVACILCGSRCTLNSVHELVVSCGGAQLDHASLGDLQSCVQ